MDDQERRENKAPREGSTERSGELPSRGAPPDPEVLEKPKRRRFTAEYKQNILDEAAACSQPGEVGALLRREGLYSSLLAVWRKQARLHGTAGLGAKKRGPASKPKASARELQLERENRALEKRLAKAEAIIDFQKKAHELLGIPLKQHDLDEDD